MKHFLSLVAFSALAAVSPLGAQAGPMPTLRPAFTTHDIDLAPLDRLTPIAVGPQGYVLFVSSKEASEPQMTLLDSTGKLVRRFGKTGGGPGEVRTPRPVDVGAAAISVWDRGNGVFLQWDLKGALQSSVHPTTVGEPTLVSKEVVALRNVSRIWRPVAMDRTSGEFRDLLPATDTFLSAHFGIIDGKPLSSYSPMVGFWNEGFVVADAGKYSLALYRWNGTLVRVLHREVPPSHASAGRIDEFLTTMNRQAAARGQPAMGEAQRSAMRKQGMEQPLPALTPGGAIRTDARGRIWVMGMEGDSAFADLFSADRFLGRLPVPCRLFNGFWSVTGNWLAVSCLPDDPNSVADAVVKLFKVVG